jgi:hypothetical protein
LREREELHRIEVLLEEIRDHLLYPLRAYIVPLGVDMTTTPPAPFELDDDESLPLGLALDGSNPNDLTITSAVWSVDATVTIDQTAPALTATAVTTPGTDGTANVTAVLTLSDGSTLTTPAFVIDVVASPVPLSATIVAGTPVPNA